MGKALLTLAVLALIVVAVYLAERALDRYRPKTGTPLRILIALLLVIAIGFVAIKAASAHDHSRPDLKPWFESLRSRAGAYCCDGSDYTRLEDVDWESRDGGYRVRIDGQWVDVPEGALVDGPNKAGVTMVWPWFENGKPAVRCFKPGTMG
jgi:hypothetical protein